MTRKKTTTTTNLPLDIQAEMALAKLQGKVCQIITHNRTNGAQVAGWHNFEFEWAKPNSVEWYELVCISKKSVTWLCVK